MESESATPPTSVSINEFARRHSISPRTVYSEITAGKLVARKCRGRTLITADDERAWLASLPKLESSAAA
jgi:hypothetical protein